MKLNSFSNGHVCLILFSFNRKIRLGFNDALVNRKPAFSSSIHFEDTKKIDMIDQA